MHSGFVHSIKVPRLYKSAAKIIKEVREKGGSLKSLIYEQNHPNVSAIYSLCLNTLRNEEYLNRLLKKTNILVTESRLDPWLAKILITELLWGKSALRTNCKPALTILSYEKELREELNNIKDIDAHQTSHKTVKKPRYVRINTLLVTLKRGIAWFREEGWSLMPKCSSYVEHLNVVKNLRKPNFIQDFHIPELLVFPSDTTFHNHPGYQNGEIILQDKASCFPSLLLNPKPRSVILDMCAAPGMKSSHLAALVQNSGKIYAVEIDGRRYETLCEQIKVTAASCVETVHKDALTLDANEYSNVEYILVDPTCSGSGMLDRQAVYGKEKCDPQRLKQLQAFQVFLLRHALLNFPNVKRVVYSTCSINPEENEEVIDEILENVQDAYKLVPINTLLKGDWQNFSSKKYKCLDKCLYAKSDIDLSNDFFVAVFERNFDVPLPAYKSRENVVTNNQKIKETEVLNVEKVSTTRKRKKRGKKNKNQGISNDEEMSNSFLNASSDSVNIIEELNNDNDLMQSNGNEHSQNDVFEVSDGNDDEPIIKKKKGKAVRKVIKFPKEEKRLPAVKLQRNKKKIS